MKKFAIIGALVAVALSFTSCKQEEDPKYHAPTTFTINEPALKDQAFRTASEMTDTETFNLFCSQPDYGYAAVCNYSALVSLDKDAPEEEWLALENTTPTSAQMSIKTFELGVAVNKLLDVKDAEDFADRNLGNQEFVCYFKGVCEIPGIEGSRIVSSNAVSYNKVMINYAEKTPAWIYICGDISNIETGLANAFLSPAIGNYDIYKENFALFEPEDMIGEKLYVGTFNLTPKDSSMENFNAGNPDACAQFRFFTELLGWVADASLGSNEADFYCLNITDKWESGFSGDIVTPGLGNWGVFVEVPTAVTIVVDQPNLKIWVKEGQHEVTFVGRDPEFN
ncbi:MAG: hypothetical protein K2O78_09790 [Muribaculaceae bacterium]|nr:hypothetical protein [Muribaculaceae bacterium]MDE7081929.1 hypothetical protein [Muribaculaceae bacterium]